MQTGTKAGYAVLIFLLSEILEAKFRIEGREWIR